MYRCMYPTFQCLTLGACILMSSGTCITVCGFLSVVRVLLALRLHCMHLYKLYDCTGGSDSTDRGKPCSLRLGSTCHQDAVICFAPPTFPGKGLQVVHGTVVAMHRLCTKYA